MTLVKSLNFDNFHLFRARLNKKIYKKENFSDQRDHILFHLFLFATPSFEIFGSPRMLGTGCDSVFVWGLSSSFPFSLSSSLPYMLITRQPSQTTHRMEHRRASATKELFMVNILSILRFYLLLPPVTLVETTIHIPRKFSNRSWIFFMCSKYS